MQASPANRSAILRLDDQGTYPLGLKWYRGGWAVCILKWSAGTSRTSKTSRTMLWLDLTEENLTEEARRLDQTWACDFRGGYGHRSKGRVARSLGARVGLGIDLKQLVSCPIENTGEPGGMSCLKSAYWQKFNSFTSEGSP